MAIKKKIAKLQNLSQVTTFIEESGLTSEFFNIADIPSQFPIGKSSILIMGSRFLREDVVIKMELLDSAGNPIYLEPVVDYSESGGVRVSVIVYDDVAPGTASLTILAELDPLEFNDNIPAAFSNKYNLKHTVPITINTEIPNDRPIRFFKRPKVTVTEVVKGQLTTTNATSGSNTQSLGVVFGDPSPGSEGKAFLIDTADFGEIATYTDRNFGFSPIGNYTKEDTTRSKYSFRIDGNTFKPEMVGGKITISSPNAKPGFVQKDSQTVQSYTSRITKVINANTIEVQKPFGLYDASTKKYVTCTLNSSAYSIVYPKTSEFSKSVVNFKSFADIQIKDVKTFSGDVSRVAAYSKNNGPYGNWTKIIDTPVEAPELLVDENSQTGTSRIGRFTTDSAVATYWNSTHGSFGSGTSTTLVTASDPEYLSDSLFVSSSGIDMLAVNDNWIKVQLKSQHSMSFEAGTEYVLRANLIADHRNETDTVQNLKAVFHLSGSAFGMSTNYGDQGYGRAIGIKSIVSASSQVYGINEPLFETTFTPDSSGTAILQMRFTAGHWHVSDLSIRPNSSTNFSPEFIRVVAPVPPLQRRPDRLDFAFEFYDVNNNKSSTVVTTLPDNPDGVEFNGENVNILGDDNSVGGSLFLGGDATGSGVQMGGVNSKLPETGGEGAQGSGFIRSVRYQGFTSASQAGDNTGFMIYSGSVLPDSGDNYAGVGLELVGESGSLRFGTKPSRFEVVADAFFVGSTNTQFISGSGGIIEISSSAFHLSSSGDVIISGSVTATSGDIGGWQIIDNKLSGSNATLDAAGAAIYKSDQGPDTNPNDGYYIDFTPSNSNPFYVRFGPDFAVSSSGRLIASGALIEGVVTASGGLIANWVIGSNTISKATGGTFTGLSSVGDTRIFAGASSLTNSGSAAFNVKSNGDISGSQVLFTGGKIGGFVLTDSILRNSNNTVELSSTLPGLKIKDAGGTSRVEVKSGSLSTIGGGTQYIGNKSFEEQLGSLSAGRNFVGSINSWSFSEGGGVNISLTDRNAYDDDEKAVSGRVTVDVVVPAGSGNYSANNTYELSQIVTASISQGDTLSFSSVARFSSSFGGKGKDRALGPQYFRVEYWNGSAFVPFLPANEFTASNGYGEYFLGSGQYASFGASAEIPASSTHLKLILTGSINDDSGFTIEKPLFVGDKGTVNSDISGRKFTKTVVGSASPEYPETEITFDNFSLRSNTRKVEMTQEGLLIYNSEDSFLKMTGAGIEFRGGSGLATFGQAINRESFTNDSQIAGTLAAPALQAYASDPEDIGTTASDGNVGEFAKGNHRHRLTSGTLDTVLASTSFSSSVQGRFVNVTAGTGLTGGGSSGTITLNVVGGAGITANANDITVDSTVIRTTGAQSLGGIKTFSDEIQATGGLAVTGAVTASTNISASLTGSFGHILINGSPLQAATGTNTGDVSLAGSRNYITLGANQVITVGEVDISDDTNLATGNGITLSGDTLSTNDSQIVHDNLSGFVANEHVDHSTVSISAGSGLTGGGTILANRTIHVGAGTGITVNSNDIQTNDSEIVHDNLSGFVANEHIDHSGVSITAGSGLTGGGDITTTRTLNIGAGTGVTVNANDIAIGQAIGTSNTPSFAGLTINGTSVFNISGTGQFRIESAGTNAVHLKSIAGDEIYFGSNNSWQLRFTTGGTAIYIGDNVDLLPSTDGNSDLGSSSLRFRDVFTDAITVTNNITVGGTVDGRNISTDGTKLDGIAANADNFNKVKIAGDNNVSGNDVTSGQAFTIAGGTGITTSIAARTATVGITADSIGDTQLAFNTGQHLTTSSTPTFAGLTSTGTINVGGGSIQKQGTHDLSLHSVKHISFDWDANYDSYVYHGISSRDGVGNFSDDLTIASFDDIHIRVDSNNNDGPAFMNMYNNTYDSATIFGKWGYDGTNHILYHSGRVGIGTDNPQNAVHISGNTNSNLEITTGTAGLITLQSLNDARNAYEDLSLYGDNVDINANTSGKVLFTAPILSGSAASTGSFGRLDAHKIVADGSGTPLEIQGTSGSLFSVSDSFSGSLMSVSDVSGIPILEVFDDDRVVMGSYSSPAMTVTGSKVGIGTASPTSPLHIHTTSGDTIFNMTGDAANQQNFRINAPAGSNRVDFILPEQSAAGVMTITSGQNVGIGDTSPSFKLDVNGTSRVTGVARFDSTMQFNGNQTIETVGGSDSLFINPQANLHLGTTSTDHTYIGAASRNVTINATTTTINNTLAASTINASGNITVTGTVDGRDVASDGTKLDGIEANAKNDQTITAGSGLTGGGTGDVTLNIGAGTGIDVAADAISVDVSDFMTNGSNNRILTATGTDAMNAEANLTFDGSSLQITAGSSGALFQEYSSGMALWLDGSNGDFSGGDYFGIHAYSTTDLAFSYAGTTRMTIKSGGNVGIGVSAPANLLQVGSHVHVTSAGLVGIGLAAPETDLHIAAPSPAIRFTDENVSNLKHQIIGGGDAGLEYSADFNNVAAGYHRWDISGAEKMRLIENGNLGLGGVTAPSRKIHIDQTVTTQGGIYVYSNAVHTGAGTNALIGIYSDNASANGDTLYVRNDGTGNLLTLNNDGTDRLVVKDGGNVGIGTASPASLLHLRTSANENLEFEEASGNLRISALNDARSANVELQFAASQFHFLTGNVGIGTTGPGQKLHVVGGVQINHSSFATSYGLRLTQADSGNGGVISTFESQRNTSWTSVVQIGNGANSDNPSLRVRNGNAIFDSNVGIGSTSPYSALNVRGANTTNGPAKRLVAFFDTTSATTGTGAGISLGGYTNGTGGDINDLAVIQGIKENGTAGNYASALTFQTRANGANTQEQMRISSTGNVGIGVTPTAKLHVKGGAYNTNMILQGGSAESGITMMGSDGVVDGYVYANGGSIGFLDDDTHWAIQHQTDTKTTFFINNTQHMILTSTGLGIGQSSPSYKLDVTGTFNVTSNATHGGYIQTNTVNASSKLTGHNGGLEVQSSQTDYGGIFVSDTNGDFVLQLYGSSHVRYGFLATEWGNWDFRKEIGGVIYTNNQTTYYLQPESTSNFNIITTAGNITVGAQLLAGAGSATAPSISFSGDTNTGIYNDGSNDNLKFTTAGVDRAFLSATQFNVTGNIVASGTLSGTTLNTGQGANELYAMDQNVRTTDTVTFGEVRLVDSNTRILEGSGNGIRVQTNSGYIDIGPTNTSYAHIMTDRAQFYINKKIVVDSGLVSSYDEDLVLQRAGTAKVTFGTATTTHHQDVIIANGEAVGSAVYASGFAGSGWRIDQGITETGKTSAAFDNLVVRGTMSIYELLVQQVRATNGNLFISSTGKVDSVSESGGTYTLGVDTGEGSGHGFAAGDVLRMQRFDNTGGGASVTISDLTVQAVSSTGSFTATLRSGTVAPAAGFEYVRLGSTSNASRRGGIYLTADDSNAPFIDVFDEITQHTDFNTAGKTKTRMGKLSGITSARFGALSGFGFWASGSVYLEGSINATAGNIGGWGISGNAISSSDGIIDIDANDKRITITDGSNDRIYLGEITGSTEYGLKIFDGTGVTDSDLLVELGSARNQIVGWDLTPGNIVSDNAAGSVRLSSTAQALTIWTGSVNEAEPKLVVGKLPLHDGTVDEPYGFAVFSGSGTVSGSEANASVLITANKARLAGWELIPGRLSSGTVADINGNNASIALGTGATTATGTPTDGLFFVSASSSPVFYVGSSFSYVGNVLKAAGWTVSSAAIEKDDVKLTSATNASYLGIGATAFEGAGIFIGQTAASTYKMSMSGSAGGMFWDNTKLSVKGANATTVFETTTTGATIGGWDISGTTISKNSATLSSAGTISLGNGTTYNTADTIFLDGPNDRMSIGTGFRYENDALVIDGSATIANFAIASTGITSNGIGIHPTGQTHAINAGSGQFTVTHAGAVVAQNAAITGDISANNITTTSGSIANFTIAATGITSTGIGIHPTGQTYAINAGGTGAGGNGQFSVTHAGAMVAQNASITGDITANNITTVSGSIASWLLSSGALTKGDVSLQANTTKPGLHITDGSTTILNVVSSSTGLTNVNDLTGSLGSGAAVQFTNNDFSVGSNNALLDTVSNTWVIDGTTWDSWEYDNAGEINSDRAFLPGKTIALADFGTAYNAGFRRDYPVEKGAKATILVSAYMRGNGWKFYGDASKVISYIDMELSGSTETSSPSTFTAIGSKRVQFTATKLQNVQVKLRNPSYNFVRLKFNAYVQASSGGKATSIATGGYVVDGLKIVGLSGDPGSGATVARSKPLVELTQDGLFVFSNKDSFIRLDADGFQIKGDIDASDITAQGSATISGSLTTLGEVNVSGSLKIENEIAIGFGTDEPEAKVMVREDFTPGGTTSPEKFFIGASPIVRHNGHGGASLSDTASARAAGAVKASFKARTDVLSSTNFDYGRTWYQAAFLSEPIRGTYGLRNVLVHGDLVTGTTDSHGGGMSDSHASHEISQYAMTSSVDLGFLQLFHGRKRHRGLYVDQQFSPQTTRFSNLEMTGCWIVHHSGSAANGSVPVVINTRDIGYGSISELNTYNGGGGSAGTSVKNYLQRGYAYTQRGTFLNSSDDHTTPGYHAGFYAENASKSTSGTSSGEVGGYGIYIKGSSWKSYFDNKVGIGVDVPTVALDVSGEIKASGNITAYSDVRHKTNIKTITNAIEIVNDLRGVRFNWNDEYKEHHNENNEFSTSGRIDRVQVGLIAQEVEEVLPELVSTDEDGFKNVNYQNMVAVLIEANKEQQKIIEDLQERVKRLESK